MEFTFGIITTGKLNPTILDSIYHQNIPKFEIIIVGGENHMGLNLKHIPFNEKKYKFTKKKNLITQEAKYENIVFMHDYIFLDYDWYKGFKKFGNDWDVCMNKIFNTDKSRYRDWVLYDDPKINWPGGGYPQIHGNNGHSMVLPPYDYPSTKYMTISGAYWVSKKHVMQQQPLDESLGWGEGEDAEWSKRILLKYEYKMNTYSSVMLLKNKRLSAKHWD